MNKPRLYLASQSPRRAELLQQVGISFERLSVAVDETPLAAEEAASYVQRLARAKAIAGWQQVVAAGLPARPVLGSDTSVVLDGQILGKPQDKADGLAMLAALSGRCHQVMTAVCLYFADEFDQVALSVSEVCFRQLSRGECERYWDSGESIDKAGGYAIQGLGAVFVEQLRGSYSGVVGLPLLETHQMLESWQGLHADNR